MEVKQLKFGKKDRHNAQLHKHKERGSDQLKQDKAKVPFDLDHVQMGRIGRAKHCAKSQQ